MSIQESVVTCLKEKYATFSGRASRSEYWWFWLATAIIGWVAGYISTILSWIIGLALFIPGLAVAVRRIHDSEHSGWWVICPIVNLVFLIIPGTEGANKYGDPEK